MEESFSLDGVLRENINSGKVYKCILRERICTIATGDEIQVSKTLKCLDGNERGYRWLTSDAING